jgi:hypothetical protein
LISICRLEVYMVIPLCGEGGGRQVFFYSQSAAQIFIFDCSGQVGYPMVNANGPSVGLKT